VRSTIPGFHIVFTSVKPQPEHDDDWRDWNGPNPEEDLDAWLAWGWPRPFEEREMRADLEDLQSYEGAPEPNRYIQYAERDPGEKRTYHQGSFGKPGANKRDSRQVCNRGLMGIQCPPTNGKPCPGHNNNSPADKLLAVNDMLPRFQQQLAWHTDRVAALEKAKAVLMNNKPRDRRDNAVNNLTRAVAEVSVADSGCAQETDSDADDSDTDGCGVAGMGGPR